MPQTMFPNESAAYREHRNRLLSSYANNFNLDYRGERPDGSQIPGVSVVHHDTDGIVRLFHRSEMMLEDRPHQRGIGLYTPAWNLLDLLPGGRGDWMPSLSYTRQRMEDRA